ncbi:hypothetical protein Tco_1440052 [Tanacetum coccineum]
MEQSQPGVSNDVLVSIEGVEELKRNGMDKGEQKESPPAQLRQTLAGNQVNTKFCAESQCLIADIEDDIMDPVKQCTTLPSHSGFLSKKLVADLHQPPITQTKTATNPIAQAVNKSPYALTLVCARTSEDTYVLTMKMEILLEPASNKLLVDGDGDALFQLESDSLPHAHAQTTKTYYKHQDSRIRKHQ